ncbi:enoyl-CoA hydratase-related protein [Roseibium sp. RKSG952]|uniref:enoyl-CoA hydratase-related protein n=1 Tax=Roseibium sp. RKSG952 TaxID=2529384 RepID=UPI0012BC8E11|nr:enoyl-CoA hydratase-related protein [Roseibium sp. RKSG952]MTH95912.1 enoyl-CoA hydratase [Roseibium sp. RKSG952]
MSDLLVNRESGVLTLTLNRPDRLNALSADMREIMMAELSREFQAPEVRAILINAKGRGFCSGGDVGLETMLARRDHIETQILNGLNRMILALRDIPVPVVAAVNGPAAGAGFSVVLASDIVLMARSARFHLSFSKIGAVLDGGMSSLLTHRIGASRTAALAMLGGTIDAATAREWGLIHEVTEDEVLQETARNLAHRLATGPTVALGMIKRQIAAAQTASLDESLRIEAAFQGKAFKTRDFEEGVTAFAESRKPVFEGR